MDGRLRGHDVKKRHVCPGKLYTFPDVMAGLDPAIQGNTGGSSHSLKQKWPGHARPFQKLECEPIKPA
jgi:hypothetical protein